MSFAHGFGSKSSGSTLKESQEIDETNRLDLTDNPFKPTHVSMPIETTPDPDLE